MYQNQLNGQLQYNHKWSDDLQYGKKYLVQVEWISTIHFKFIKRYIQIRTLVSTVGFSQYNNENRLISSKPNSNIVK